MPCRAPVNTDHTDRSFDLCSSVFIRVPCLLAIVSLLTACSQPLQPVVVMVSPGPTPTASLTPSPTPTLTPTPTPPPTATPAGWETIADGVQTRRAVGFDGGRQGPLFELRLDPARVDVRLRYDPGHPRHVAGWLIAEQSLPLRTGGLQPLAALNAGFFDRDNTPVGLWVIDGVTYGRGHFLMQGEFRVSGAGVSIRRVDQRHISDGTRLLASLESYPLLIMPGGGANPCLNGAAAAGPFGEPCLLMPAPAERMVVGIDGAGYVVFLLIPSKTFTLIGLADWLRHSDLNLTVALNLDGGSSAGMLVQTDAGAWGVDSQRDVPGALIVVPKVTGLEGSESP